MLWLLLLPNVYNLANKLLVCRAAFAIAVKSRFDAVVQSALIPFACIDHPALYHEVGLIEERITQFGLAHLESSILYFV